MYTVDTHYLDVGQGDCSIIVVKTLETKEIVRVVVYDCGSDSGQFAGKKLLQKCRALGIDEIHVAIISHFDEDHFNGFTYLFNIGSRKAKTPDMELVRKLFKNTQLYTQGCIFKRFRNATVMSKFRKEFLSAYFFQTDTISTGSSILKDYTNFLDAIYEFRTWLDENDAKNEKTPNYTVSRLEHVTERYLAGFPTSGWTPTAYPSGKYLVYNWRPTRRVDSEGTGTFTQVKFGALDTLLGEDIMNLGFDDELHEHVTLKCIAVNTEVYNSNDLLGDTHKPIKDPNVANNMSLSCLLKYANYSSFFGGDLETTIEDRLIPVINNETNGNGLTILKAGHHGSNESTSTPFLNAMQPDSVVITCGDQNKHNHPSIDLIERLSKSKAIRQVIIAGFGVRERTLTKKDIKNGKTQEDLDADFDYRIGRYQEYGVPVYSTDIYDPEGRFILAGTFDENDDGSITIACYPDENNEIVAQPSFRHVFTRMEIVDITRNNRILSLSEERSVKIFGKFTDDGKRKWRVGEEDEAYRLMLINQEPKGDDRVTFGVEIIGGEVIQRVIKRRRIELKN